MASATATPAPGFDTDSKADTMDSRSVMFEEEDLKKVDSKLFGSGTEMDLTADFDVPVCAPCHFLPQLTDTAGPFDRAPVHVPVSAQVPGAHHGARGARPREPGGGGQAGGRRRGEADRAQEEDTAGVGQGRESECEGVEMECEPGSDWGALGEEEREGYSRDQRRHRV